MKFGPGPGQSAAGTPLLSALLPDDCYVHSGAARVGRHSDRPVYRNQASGSIALQLHLGSSSPTVRRFRALRYVTQKGTRPTDVASSLCQTTTRRSEAALR